jgi:cytochrome c
MRTILAAAIAGVVLTAGSAYAGDPESGAKVFNKCKACHMVGENAKNRVGPPLNGVVGRAFGTVEGFKYSPSLRELADAGRVWDEETLDAYLKNPKDIVPKGRMAFAGLKKSEDRDDVIAYLKQFNPDGTKKP